MRRVISLWPFVMLALVLLVVATSTAQSPSPMLSEVDRLRLVNAAQALEIAEMRRQQAAQALSALIQSLQREGYTLDLGTLTYVPVEAPAKE